MDIFSSETRNGVTIKNVFELMKPCMRECSMLVSPDGITIVTKSSNNTSATHIFLEGNKFEHFNVTESFVAGLCTLTFWKVIKSIAKNSALSMSVKKDAPNILEMRITDSQNKCQKIYRIPLLATVVKTFPETPEFVVSAKIPSSQLHGIIKDASLLDAREIDFMIQGNTLEIDSIEGHAPFQVLLFGGDDGDVVIMDRKTDELVGKRTLLQQLLTTCKASNVSPTVIIRLSENNGPMLLMYELRDLGMVKILIQ